MAYFMNLKILARENKFEDFKMKLYERMSVLTKRAEARAASLIEFVDPEHGSIDAIVKKTTSPHYAGIVVCFQNPQEESSLPAGELVMKQMIDMNSELLFAEISVIDRDTDNLFKALFEHPKILKKVQVQACSFGEPIPLIAYLASWEGYSPHFERLVKLYSITELETLPVSESSLMRRSLGSPASWVLANMLSPEYLVTVRGLVNHAVEFDQEHLLPILAERLPARAFREARIGGKPLILWAAEYNRGDLMPILSKAFKSEFSMAVQELAKTPIRRAYAGHESAGIPFIDWAARHSLEVFKILAEQAHPENVAKIKIDGLPLFVWAFKYNHEMVLFLKDYLPSSYTDERAAKAMLQESMKPRRFEKLS